MLCKKNLILIIDTGILKGITYISEQFHQCVFLTAMALREHAVWRLHCVRVWNPEAPSYNGPGWLSPSSGLQ